ncbi:hydrogenase formation protein HypD [Trichothermofontia sichuanensis B231]|uniref:hydrogenase formation protein HypD n=1 Tax=Trichothermofontia sichuanensis TaxID=3045816 RepID=UPI002247FBE8|nr:hydrogenase formation protein HypD [Trichothermofontia sichuanensis]UZQ55745.1 hydrogenase formation protein HypD [Trichothermofontia sichuanensis B231]
MKYVDEYRDAAAAHRYAEAIARLTTRPWCLMEICGGQTHAIVKYGIDQLLPEPITLIHGPGCPVCVTPTALIDQAITLAALPQVIFCSFGDMLRVPGSQRDLFSVKAAGGDVRIVYSPLDAVKLAQENPDREVIFFAIGFETTAPANAMAVYQAQQQGLKNFSLLVSQVLVPPAIAAILSAPENRVQGFLAAGHVCTVMGIQAYQSLAQQYQVPIVVTGFEPLDILQGIYLCIEQLETGRTEVVNQYSRVVRPEGNLVAQQLIETVFEVVPRQWRGIGEIPQSGLALRSTYAAFDAQKRFGLPRETDSPPERAPQLTSSNWAETEAKTCISGLVLQGVKKPSECPAFGTDCTPEHPLGATMVSSEGACAAYYRYRTPVLNIVKEGAINF